MATKSIHSLILQSISNPTSTITNTPPPISEKMGAERNSPRAAVTAPPGKSTTLRFLFDLDSKSDVTQNDDDKGFQSFELSSIISYCTLSHPYDQEPALKRLKLAQLLSIIKTSGTPISDGTLEKLFKMVASNLFRSLPPPSAATVISVIPPEEDYVLAAAPSASWAYLQIVYDILLVLIAKNDVKSIREEHNSGSRILNQGPSTGERFIDRKFILNILTLFNSDDPRERDAVKNVVHRIYSKFTFYRSFMRKALTNIILHFIYDSGHRQNGIGEILEIWGSIINGFMVPLKAEHKVFLSRVLVPLHKPKSMAVYHRQLVYCVLQFVQKEAELGGVMIGKILKYWPVTNSQKEVLLIGELEEIVENIDRRQYLKVAVPLWTRITKCITSSNSQVAERALEVWNNEKFIRVVSEDIEMVFPSLVEAIEKNLSWHWNKNIQEQAQNVKELLEELEPSTYKRCLEMIEIRELASRFEESTRMKWEKIETMVRSVS